MAARSTEIKSGAFILLAVVVLGVLLFAVGNLGKRFEAKVEYFAYVRDAKFLRSHDAVTYGGIRVGEIERVEVAPDRFGQVKIVIAIDPRIGVKRDSILILKQDGMLGPKYVEISPGTPGAPRAPEGSELAAAVVPGVSDLSAAIEKPIQAAGELLKHLNSILGDPKNKENIAAILREVKDLVVQTKKDIRSFVDTWTETGDRSTDLLEEARVLVAENRPGVRALLKSLTEGAEKLQKTADKMQEVLRDGDRLLLDNHKNIYETIRGLRDTAYHLEKAAKRIRANPAILLSGAEETPEERARKDETYLRLKGRTRRYGKEDPKKK